MNEFSYLLTAAYAPFSVALVFLAGLILVEVVGFGLGALDIDLGFDTDHDSVLGFIGFGRVPLMAILLSFTTIFALGGIGVQQFIAGFFGEPLTPWLAAPLVFVGAMPITGVFAALLARFMPSDETTAVDTTDLIGRRATIILGDASVGNPTKARVLDHHGQPHHVLVEPDYDKVNEGDELILVRMEDGVFVGTAPYSSSMRAM